MKLRSKIGEYVEESGYKRGFIAKQLNVSVDQLRLYCKGESYPPMPKAFALAKLLGKKVDDLYEVIDDDEV
ncbi:helix-turn-helix transcriptional regulator [Tuberibacillus calidus]|jgi:DNA-binding XRE family transcriptional regulator|uniref:helix-turn-helix transcriptional regulator n=1 Tax=Tuberibacillus calidus TaxID=340097 RepID=UPI00041C079F|nr:helix-turn-helix transcriptional regulator [Tuberibacillus calidus]